MYPYIHVFGQLNLPTYGLTFLIGLTCATIICYRNAHIYKADRHDVLYCIIYMVIGIFVGAKVMYFFTKLPQFISHYNGYRLLWKVNPLQALGFLFGGLTFYGGLLGAILGFFIYCRQYKIEKHPLAKVLIPYAPFVHAFGRIGCFLAGCCYGKAYDGPLSVQYPESLADPMLGAFPRFPVQLLEALINLLIFVALLNYRKKRSSEPAEHLLFTYLISYATARFFLEFLRDDVDRGVYGPVSTSQILSVLVLLISLIIIKKKRSREKCLGETKLTRN